jgi:hypothetical protein
LRVGARLLKSELALADVQNAMGAVQSAWFHHWQSAPLARTFTLNINGPFYTRSKIIGTVVIEPCHLPGKMFVRNS